MGKAKNAFALIAALAALLLPADDSHAVFEKPPEPSCIKCHRDNDEEKFRAPVALWAESVHAEAGNTCDGCHGGNPSIEDEEAMSEENGFLGVPKEGQIVGFSGKCHQELSKNFMRSQHGELEVRNCVNCHGSHAIKRISLEIISEDNCTECHEYDNPKHLKEILQNLHDKFNDSKEKMKSITGLPTNTIGKEFDKNLKKLRQVRMIIHTFDLEFIEKEAADIEESFDETAAEVGRLLDITAERKIIGYVTVSIFILLALTAFFYNRQLHHSEE